MMSQAQQTGGTRLSCATGEIEVCGPNAFKGYWHMQEKTAEDFTIDGWFKIGDIGTLDADGYVTICGRNKDLIISDGYNVYPAESEGFLDDLPEVAESAVVGVPHSYFGEAVIAFVVAKPAVALDGAALFAKQQVPRDLDHTRVHPQVLPGAAAGHHPGVIPGRVDLGKAGIEKSPHRIGWGWSHHCFGAAGHPGSSGPSLLSWPIRTKELATAGRPRQDCSGYRLCSADPGAGPRAVRPKHQRRRG